MPTPSEKSLLGRGYLPEELPPPFTSLPFANFASGKAGLFATVKTDPKRLKGVDYSASKAGYRRRLFTIPHPISQYFVVKFIVDNWGAISNHFKKSTWSASVPSPNDNANARSITITPFHELNALIHKRLGQYEFIAKSDIQRFFPSIYTHSIPWAVHGKDAAKEDGNPNSPTVTFNRLDKVIQRGQDRQTVGIPIGPDTSRIVAEIIATTIDADLKAKAGKKLCDCIRHVDDIYLAANSRADAEASIASLRMALREFGLEINETKTFLYRSNELRDDEWPRTLLRLLRAYDADKTEEQLYELFDNTFELATRLKSDAPVRFVLRWGDRNGAFDEHWDTLENFFVKCLVHHPHTVDHVARIIVLQKLFDDGTLDQEKWQTVVTNQMLHHLEMGHDHEICWLLWMAISLSIKIPDAVATELISYPSAVVALMGMHARTLGLVKKTLDISPWTNHVSNAALDKEWWLFAYECASKGWIKNKIDWTQIKGSVFDQMRKAKVTFYRSSEQSASVAKLTKGKPAIPSTGFGYDDEAEAYDADTEDKEF